jgi:hypothetical protein
MVPQETAIQNIIKCPSLTVRKNRYLHRISDQRRDILDG